MLVTLTLLLSFALVLALALLAVQRLIIRRLVKNHIARQRVLDAAPSLQTILDTLPHPVALFSPDLIIETANEPAVSLLRLWPKTPAAELPHRWLMPLLEEVKSRRQPVHAEQPAAAVQVFDQGRELFLVPRAIPLAGAAGDFTGIALILIDATGRRQADEAKSGLLSTVSHELKTPLTSLQMAIHLLVDDASNGLAPRDRELLTTARQDAERLNQLIDDLLDVGRLRSGKAPLQVEPLHAGAIVDAAVRSLQREISEKGLAIQIDLPDTLPAVHADLTRAAYAMAALLTAARRMAKTGATVAIGAQTHSDSQAIVIQLRHDAVDPLFAEASSPSGRDGISLAVAREIAAAHRGGIERLTAPEGPQWRFTLPLAPLG
ncbi:MAG TPA: histidine kinase dimerization/phospho-acceptor domain-containing protein [Phycisphaerae bacterium]|nr:histidine kinase dimerization/phospho-acceptor domain-containing protein [Phycisphaerae bacterium]